LDLNRVKEEYDDINVRLNLLRCQEPYQSPAQTLPSIQQQLQQQQQQQHPSSLEEPSIFAPFPAYSPIDTFEPECLPRNETQWAATSSSFPAPLITAYGGYSTPTYEEPSLDRHHHPHLQFSMENPIPTTFASTSTPQWSSSFPTPMSTPSLRDLTGVRAFPFGGIVRSAVQRKREKVTLFSLSVHFLCISSSSSYTYSPSRPLESGLSTENQ